LSAQVSTYEKELHQELCIALRSLQVDNDVDTHDRLLRCSATRARP
jgi:hypothetical protein